MQNPVPAELHWVSGCTKLLGYLRSGVIVEDIAELKIPISTEGAGHADLPGRWVEDLDCLAGLVDEHLLAGDTVLAHDRT